MPVLAESKVSPFFDDALDYRSFTLSGLPKLGLPTLHETLARVSDARLRRLQASALAHRRLLLWDGAAGGLAYNVTLHELCWRWRTHVRSGASGHAVRCEALLPAEGMGEAAGLVLPPHRRREHDARMWTRRGGSGALARRREAS